MKETYFFDKDTNSFLPGSLKDAYVASGTWSKTMVPVTQDVFLEFSSPKDGFERCSGADGHPTWVAVAGQVEKLSPRSINRLIRNITEELDILKFSSEAGSSQEDDAIKITALQKRRLDLYREREVRDAQC